MYAIELCNCGMQCGCFRCGHSLPACCLASDYAGTVIGYQCTMYTDTEVVAYIVDHLIRRHRLPVELAAKVMAPPLWSQIERMEPQGQALLRTLRQVYSSLLINGPFTVIIAREAEMIGLTDRVRLRPLTAAVSGDRLYLSSEEAAILMVCPEPDRVWTPVGGEPVVGRLGGPLSPRSERFGRALDVVAQNV